MPRKTHPKRQPKRHRPERARYVETIVVRPVGMRHGKRAFASEEIAAEALLQARAHKISQGVDPVHGHIERGHYECDRCGLHHLTSWPDGAYKPKEAPDGTV